MQIELVVFDMAGTTVRDDGDDVGRCLRVALEGAGVRASRDEVNAVMGLPKPEAIRAMLQLRRPRLIAEIADRAEIERIHQRFLALIIDHYATSQGVAEVEGASRAFDALHDAGVRVALDTGFSRPIAQVILERLGWARDGRIDACVTSDEVTRGRPFPELIFEAMRRTSVRDVAAVAKVGDTPSDLQEGTSAGCSLVIGVTEGTHTAAQLRAHPHTHLVASVEDVPELVTGWPLRPSYARSA